MSSSAAGPGSSRNIGNIMQVVPSFTAGKYTATVSFQVQPNEKHLSIEIEQRITTKSRAIGGSLVSSTTSYSLEGFLVFTQIFTFQNKFQLIYFTQGIGFPQETRGVYFVYDSNALAALP